MVTALLEKARRFKRRRVHSQHSEATPPVVTVTPPRYFRWKSTGDFCLAAVLLLPSLPLMAILIVLVRLTSRGPALFRQCRMGQNGKAFDLYKIRSMAFNAEERTGPVWTQDSDPRVTPLGHLLRKFHLDELPQLFNVLKGEMALVGPRPERPEFVEILTRQIPDYANRLAVRPGITGLAQLNLPPDSDLDSVRRKVILDVEYIRTASVWLDLKLLCCTTLRIFKLPVLGLFGLQKDVILPLRDDHKSKLIENNKAVTPKQIQREAKMNSFDECRERSRRDSTGKNLRPKLK